MANTRVLMCLLAVLSAVFRNSHCQYQQINLRSNNVTCNMSTVYTGHGDGDSLSCVGAIDGDTDIVWRPTRDPRPNCIFTQPGYYPAYWFLNLQQELTIHKVTIYYVIGYDYYMRNVRVAADGNKVFTYPDSQSSISNPEHITGNLPVRASIIKIERTTSNDKNYLPLCQVQLWECETSRYGSQCAAACNLKCQEVTGMRTCDAINGTCLNGCKPSDGRFSSSLCNGCQVGYLGHNCTERCSENCDGGCGQYDRRCNNCKAGHWGDECNMLCKRGCQDNACNRDNGQCTCKPGWQQPGCDVCDNYHYGADCDKKCGNCTGEARCNNQTGYCPSCVPGLNPPLCQEECPAKTYSQNCSSPCGHCADDGDCDTVTGHCPAGCGPGYKGQRCDEECSHFTYGNNCSQTCGNCSNYASCHHVTGNCAGGCVAGFDGDKCTMSVSEKETHTDGNLTGPIVGGLLGAGAVIGLSVLLAALIIRRRRSPQPPFGDNTGELPMSDSRPRQANNGKKEMTGGIPDHTSTSENNYSALDTYVNPDDMNTELYTALPTTARRGHPNSSRGKKLAAAGNDDAAAYQNVSMH